jgi:hypothetical protein
LDVENLQTFFHTFEGVAKAVDDVSQSGIYHWESDLRDVHPT